MATRTKSILLLLALVLLALMLAKFQGVEPHGVTGFFDGH